MNEDLKTAKEMRKGNKIIIENLRYLDEIGKKTEIRILILAMREYVTELILEYQKMHPEMRFVAIYDADKFYIVPMNLIKLD